MRSQSFILSSFRCRSLHFAVGVTVGSLFPNRPCAPFFLCFLPTRVGAAGGSHFFFFPCRSLKNSALVSGSLKRRYSLFPLFPSYFLQATQVLDHHAISSRSPAFIFLSSTSFARPFFSCQVKSFHLTSFFSPPPPVLWFCPMAARSGLSV